MKVLMFGWELPPYNSGGLGTACLGLTKSLAKQDIEVTFVLPFVPEDLKADHMKLLGALQVSGKLKNRVKVKMMQTILTGYMGAEEYGKALTEHEKIARLAKGQQIYGRDIFEEVERYSANAGIIASSDEFDVIHCHDWMTYEAGINARRVLGKPLVLHVHATEFDRTGGNNNQHIYEIEKKGFMAADYICAVSQFTKDMVVQHYGISQDKIIVVHNGVEFSEGLYHDFEPHKLKKYHKIVLYLGRITIQKGPDWFLKAAKLVHDRDPDVKFVFAGSGDMELRIIEEAAELGIAQDIIFTGFLRGKDIERAYQMADLYVMPSISEPFGITPLESMKNGTPVLISRQSGVSEVIRNAIKVDFWDTHKMAEKILEVLNDKEMHNKLKEQGIEEVKQVRWDDAARKCIEVYSRAVQQGKVALHG